MKTTESKKVHANFGWYGQCDGYYTFNIFDLTALKPDGRYEPDYGDSQDTANAVYTTGFEMLIYDLWN